MKIFSIVRLILKKTGQKTVYHAKSLNLIFAVTWSVIWQAFQWKNWTRDVREVFLRQILFTGVEGLKFIVFVSIMIGGVIVVQAQMWVNSAGSSNLLGPILVSIVIREVAPLVTNLTVIARSGTAIAAELANMRVNREVRVLEGMGIDPLIYLVLPRVLGVCVSVFCLTILFIIGSLLSGYFSSQLLGNFGDFFFFWNNVLKAIQLRDIYNLLSKSLIASFFVGIISSVVGLNIQGEITEVPKATTYAVEYSIGAVFVISWAISILTYL